MLQKRSNNVEAAFEQEVVPENKKERPETFREMGERRRKKIEQGLEGAGVRCKEMKEKTASVFKRIVKDGVNYALIPDAFIKAGVRGTVETAKAAGRGIRGLAGAGIEGLRGGIKSWIHDKYIKITTQSFLAKAENLLFAPESFRQALRQKIQEARDMYLLQKRKLNIPRLETWVRQKNLNSGKQEVVNKQLGHLRLLRNTSDQITTAAAA